MTRSYVALGTNVGDRLLNLSEARRQLSVIGPHRRGPVVETPALLPSGDSTPQAAYLNTVDELEVSLSAVALLGELKRIERRMGRALSTRWAARVIDLDLIFFGDQVIETEGLTVPHPSMHERLFVLTPLVMLAPETRHPVLQRTARQLYDQLQHR